MIYNSNDMELRAVMDTAQAMCAAARTAPKARGFDRIVTAVLTGEDKDALAAEMERMGAKMGADFFIRDGGNLRAAQAIVLIGIRESKRGLGGICGYCHFADCAECARQAVVEVLGEEAVGSYEGTLSGEDFSEYLRFVPITADEYAAIEQQLAANTYEYQIFVEDE